MTRVQLRRGSWIDGKPYQAGQTVAVSDSDALWLVRLGRAVVLPAAEVGSAEIPAAESRSAEIPAAERGSTEVPVAETGDDTEIGGRSFVDGRDFVALRRVKGIGPTWARRLIELGITTPAQLAAANAWELAKQMPGVSDERIQKWQRAAIEKAD